MHHAFKLIQGYSKSLIHFQNATYSKVLQVQIWLMYENNRKLTNFVLCAPDGSTSLISFSISQNEAKWRKDSRAFVFHHYGVPPNCNVQLRWYRNDELHHHWTWHVHEDEFTLFPSFRPRLPVLTPCELFP